ncbi:hypothetical protein C3F09_02815 [candidate division GN15 bacterium]|uniref:DNA polymerase III subunit delta n=1 Tax=candidate division GN15 bacterium TaxID=2072418 RepID=A0A855X637_9BACT|nr:MAG: hypothetical protein C3F09_02815 [candidate division GN15 bacterium]
MPVRNLEPPIRAAWFDLNSAKAGKRSIRQNGYGLTPSEIGRYQPKPWSILTRSYAANRVASTYLFWGREGLGHWPLALSFAALLNCRGSDKSKDKPCGECDPCRQIGALGFAGLHIIVPITSHKNMNEAIDLTNEILDEKRKEPFRIISSAAQTTIPIDLARETRGRLALKAEPGIRRVVLFYQMEKMLHASADALLKMIEEPPLDTTLILTTASPDMLLPTIQSRAQKIRLDRIPDEAIQHYLIERYHQEEGKALRLARLSEGNLGVALDMVEGESDGDELSQRAIGFLLFKSMFLDSSPTAASHVVELLAGNDRSQAEDMLRLWQSLIRDCAHYAATGDTEQIVNSDFRPDIIAFARRFERTEAVSTITAAIKNTLADIRLNVHIPTAIVALVLKVREAIGAAR